ncbi:MAG: phospholipid carrier-dependent glycosyltransferase [Planctomycetota bacterium]|nr:phospholipid carrier-dependent glycosyltransferase [Planctomycetota bacterium]
MAQTATTNEGNKHRSSPLFVAAVVALLIAAMLQCAAFWWTKSTTFDETFYLNCALQTVQDRQLDPRLAKNGAAPIGALLSTLPVAAILGGQERPDEWQGQTGDVAALSAARVLHALLTVIPLTLIAFFWLHRRHGGLAGITGASLVAFSPTIIAHSALATTDAVFATAAVVALIALSWDREGATWKTKAIAVVTIALAISTKYSGVFLLPVAVLSFAIDDVRKSDAPNLTTRLATVVPGWIGKTIVFTIAVLLTVWLLHGLQLVSLPGRSLAETPRLLQPAPVFGTVIQFLHNGKGHHSYLMGGFSMTGWWYYFPCALALKSTPSEFVLLLLLLPVAVRNCLWGERKTDLAAQTFVLGIVVLLLLVMRARINIGHRYLLPIYPLAILLSIDQLWHSLPARFVARNWACGLLVAVQIGSSLSIAPHYLSYFTPLIGGPSRGADYLIDSNLDWGQDLPLLKRELDRLGHRRILLQYFGNAAPEGYGIEYSWLYEVPPEQWDEYDAVAVSETFMRGGYSYGRDPFERLRERTPAAWAGYSMRIYDLADEQVRSDLEEAQRRELPRIR